MKENNRFLKAVAVIIIVGFGLIYNMNMKTIFSDFNYTESIQSEMSKTDSLKSEPNRLFIYTKCIINEGIHHLISNL